MVSTLRSAVTRSTAIRHTDPYTCEGMDAGKRSQSICWTIYSSNRVISRTPARTQFYNIFFFFFFFFLGGGGVGRGGVEWGLTWTSGKSYSETSGYGLNTVNFLFGSCASCMNVINLFIYLFIRYHWVQIFKFLSNLLYVETNGNGTKLLRQLLTIKLILLLIWCSELCACVKRLGGAYCWHWHMCRSEVRS